MRTIEEDILSWSTDFLELPTAELGGKRVWPYAKMARTQGLLKIVVETTADNLLQTVVKECNHFKDSGKEICIIACPDLSITDEELDNYTHTLNHVFVPKDVYLMAFLPQGYEEQVEFLENGD